MDKLNTKPIFDFQDNEISHKYDVHFGSLISMKLERQGELIHKTAIKFILPEVIATYKKVTNKEVVKLLELYSIIWTPANISGIFTVSELNEVNTLINSSLTALSNNKLLITEILDILNLVNTDDYSNISQYENDVYEKLFALDQYNIHYNFLIAQKNDNILNNIVVNSSKIQSILYEKFLHYTTSNSLNYYLDENLEFLYNTEIANYVIDNSIQQLSASYVFNTAISNIYFGLSGSFLYLDAYKIFSNIIDTEISNFNFDIQVLLAKILANIRYGLIKNTKKLLKVYDSLKPDIQFILFRRLKTLGGSTYDLSEEWLNLSTLHNSPVSDNYTSDFILESELNEPLNISHAYGKYVDTEISILNDDNRNFFRINKFGKYFDNHQLFSRLNIYSPGNPAIDGFNTLLVPELLVHFSGSRPQLEKVYFLNYVPFLTANDIPIAINRIASNYQFFTSLNIQLLSLKTQLIIDLKDLMIANNNFDILYSVANTYKQTYGVSGDLQYQAVLKNADFLVHSGVKYSPIRYVIIKYIELLQSFASLTYTDELKTLLISVVNIFITPLSNIPSYQTYLSNNNNITTNVIINTVNQPVLSDIISSIWASINDSVISNFNNVYNNKILAHSSIIPEKFGIEMKRYIVEILSIYFNQTANINYWHDTPITNMYTPIFTYLQDQISQLSASFDHYDTNRLLLNFRNLVLDNSFYYQTFDNIVIEFTDNNVESKIHQVNNTTELLYFHEDHGTINDPAIIIKNELLANTYPIKNTPLNIINIVNAEFEKLIVQTTNPWISNTDKYDVWNKFWLPSKTFNTITERNKYLTLFSSFVNTQYLFTKKNIFETKYNNLSNESDVYDFMVDTIISSSTLKDLLTLSGITPSSKHQNIIDFYSEKLTSVDSNIAGLQSLSENLIKLTNYGKPANFSWKENIGHILIEYVELKINDQIIDRQSGELIEILHNISKSSNKENRFRRMIGNSEYLTSFNKITKPQTIIIVPLKFWFCNFIEHSLPIIALIHSNIEINIKIREFSEITNNDSFVNYSKMPKLKEIGLIINNVHVGNKEKYILSKKVNDYLIVNWQYYDNLYFSEKNITIDNNRNIVVESEIEFTGPVKELFFAFQPITNKYYDFLDNGKHTIDSVKLQFAGRDREIHKHVSFYNYASSTSHNISDLPDGLLYYSFSLNPLKLQPSGTANFNKIKSIILTLKPTVSTLEKLKLGNKYRLLLYGSKYQLLRITNGLGATI